MIGAAFSLVGGKPRVVLRAKQVNQRRHERRVAEGNNAAIK
ncbi:hypothetical protein AM1_C0200 (plasmid) [Acaryochloris marina MBIC11017]|uniref:Uncharacterized protein n=1 Tax=Acaryochloris marina (strain MBIC 11017) TaxID=329726 RepID=A8ZMT7_ACAM1|nr:hypothetical protein AM1_C0200 [Acaryochloris marina MBIC11017]